MLPSRSIPSFERSDPRRRGRILRILLGGRGLLKNRLFGGVNAALEILDVVKRWHNGVAVEDASVELVDSLRRRSSQLVKVHTA